MAAESPPHAGKPVRLKRRLTIWADCVLIGQANSIPTDVLRIFSECRPNVCQHRQTSIELSPGFGRTWATALAELMLNWSKPGQLQPSSDQIWSREFSPNRGKGWQTSGRVNFARRRANLCEFGQNLVELDRKGLGFCQIRHAMG